MWKRSEQLAVLKLIAVHQLFICLSNGRHAVWTPRAIRSKKFIIRLNGSGYPFKKTHQPFERLKLPIRKKSLAVRAARAIRTRNSSAVWMAQLSVREFISRSNGSSYLFEKFIRRSNGSSCPCKKETMSFFGSRSNKTRLQNKSPCFVKWCMPLWLHYTNSRHVSVLCLSSFNFK